MDGFTSFIGSSILSGILYDILKFSKQITLEKLRESLIKFTITETTLNQLHSELSKLNIGDHMSEKAIQEKIEKSDYLMNLLKQVQPKDSFTINQKHSGSGDNVVNINK